LPKKLTTFFIFWSSPLKDCLNIPPNPAKTILKIDSCSGWGCTSCPGGALTHFSCKLGQKMYSPPWGVQVHQLHPLATPMAVTTNLFGDVFSVPFSCFSLFPLHSLFSLFAPLAAALQIHLKDLGKCLELRPVEDNDHVSWALNIPKRISGRAPAANAFLVHLEPLRTCLLAADIVLFLLNEIEKLN